MALNFYCDTCQNTGWIDCHCGGDLCVCENNGEEPCPYCCEIEDDPYEGDVLEQVSAELFMQKHGSR